MYISDNYVSFNSNIIGIRTRAVIPISNIASVTRESNTKVLFYGITITTRDVVKIFFEFHSSEVYHKCFESLASRIEESEKNKEYEKNKVMVKEMSEIPSPMQITCLTIGTRGDIQPYMFV